VTRNNPKAVNNLNNAQAVSYQDEFKSARQKGKKQQNKNHQ
jgi:hypothetical protein